MEELSLHILDIAQNSIKAEAKMIQIEIRVVEARDIFIITIQDDGYGMTPEQVEKVIDPFYTTRTTRKVGMGVPLFKMMAEQSGGSFQIETVPNFGTVIVAAFGLTNIDRAPLGDIAATMGTLVQMSGKDVDFIYRYCRGEEQFEMDTREIRELMEGADITSAPVVEFIQDFVRENQAELDRKADFKEGMVINI